MADSVCPEGEPTLVERARAGDRRALDELARLYLDRTFRIAVRIIGNREDAEDVVQETFARAFQRLAAFRGRSSFGTWITSIAIRLCLDLERSRVRRGPVVPLAPLEGGEPAALPAASPRLRAEERELRVRLDAEVRALPARLRSAFVLRVLEGLEYAAVAGALGTTVRSARIYVSEARRRLAERMALLDPEADS